MLPSAAGFRRGREEKSVESDGEGGRVLVRGKEARFREEKRQGRGKTEEATTVQPALAAAVDRPERERNRRWEGLVRGKESGESDRERGKSVREVRKKKKMENEGEGVFGLVFIGWVIDNLQPKLAIVYSFNLKLLKPASNLLNFQNIFSFTTPSYFKLFIS